MNEEEQTSQTKPKNRLAWLWITLGAILLGIIVYFGIALIKKDTAKAPTDGTSDSASISKSTGAADVSAEKEKDFTKYGWSTMNQGPYNDKISYAISADLLKWTDSGKILAEHASVPDAIVKDGKIYTYFVDVSEDGFPEKIGLITSADNGKTWSAKQTIKVSGVDDRVPVDPDPFLLPDGRIRLYYFDIEEARSLDQTQKSTAPPTNKIYSAISDDGINFMQEEGVRFKYQNIFDPDVVNVGNIWRMYVGTGDNKILSAVSNDGLTFNYESIAINGAVVPNIYYDGTKYFLFTAGINIYTSTDGKQFTILPNKFDNGQLAADPGVVKLNDNSYLMLFKTKALTTNIK